MATDVIQGAVKVLNLPDLACFTNFQDFVQRLAESLVIEIPSSISNVVIGNQEPTNPNDALWVRRDNSGTVIGLYVYTSGAWTLLFPLSIPSSTATTLNWVVGSTLNIPTGYVRADEYPGFTVAQQAAIQAMWNPDPLNPGSFDIYQVVFVG